MLEHLFWLGFALAASPGPDFFLITGNTLSAGRMLGYITLAGNRLSLCIHIAAAVLGLALILQQSVLLYITVSVLGGAYLIYLGWTKLRLFRQSIGDHALAASSVGEISPQAAFRQGFFNNLFNPKTSLFFLSLFPQFTSTEALENYPLIVAAAFFVGNTVWWVPLVFAMGFPRLRSGLKKCQKLLDLGFGMLFVAYGLRVIMIDAPQIYVRFSG